MSERSGRSWDAAAYHALSGPMVDMGRAVVDRLGLDGTEHVLDIGCGSGRLTQLLVERLPDGHVTAIDTDPEMVRAASQALAAFGDRVTVEQRDALALGVQDRYDGVFSAATFHWILDHDRLFHEVFRALRPSARLVAQCGGHGNIAACLEAADEAATDPRWAARFDGWERPSYYATVEETEQRLETCGFVDVRCWSEPNLVVPGDARAYLRTITLGPHLERLSGDDERSAFLDAVLARLPAQVTIDYVRLNVDARKPG